MRRHGGARRPRPAPRVRRRGRRRGRRPRPGSARRSAPRRSTSAHGPNLEARARDARYAALPADVLTGHTADDQAETVLLNLLRGASSTGLAAMRPAPRRPILGPAPGDDRPVLPCAGDHDRRRPIEPRRGVPAQPGPPRAAADAEPAGRPRPGAGADPPGRTCSRDDGDLLDELAAHIDPTDAKGAGRAPAAAGPTGGSAAGCRRITRRTRPRSSGCCVSRAVKPAGATSAPVGGSNGLASDCGCSANQRRRRADNLAIECLRSMEGS